MLRLAFLLAACALFLPARHAAAETTNCTPITSLPAVISSQGIFCLRHDLSTGISSGEAILINANNVTLDCNHWKVGGLAGGPATTASGIYALNRKNVTVRNCGVRGFRIGINLEGAASSAYQLVEGNRVELSTFYGIQVVGDGLTVRHNRVFDVGASAGEGIGIVVIGSGTVVDNSVLGVGPSSNSAVGIVASGTGNMAGRLFVVDNRISGLVASNAVSGIRARGGASVTGNLIAHSGPTPVASNVFGIDCFYGGWQQNAVRRNTLAGFSAPSTPVWGCLDVETVTD